ncbi:MAG: thiamine phosphate synthase [Clostridia bacterium]|nr:thiamine phosphate synthase [Clostridia bacterium]
MRTRKEVQGWGLYVIVTSDLAKGRPVEEVVEKALAGGAGVIQLREKNLDTRELLRRAQVARELTRRYGALLIIDDRVDIAMAVSADGVHLGQSDMPAAVARKLLGPDAIIGVSVIGDAELALEAKRDGADYVGVYVYATTSKPTDRLPVGPEGIRRLRQVPELADLPIVAIGGINRDNAAAVLAAGADCLSVLSAVVSAPDIEKAARDLAQVIQEARQNS